MTTPCARHLTVIAFIICLAVPAWGQRFLYTPQPFAADQKTPSQNGILVQEITVQKGDSLYRLSHQFSGHGMYFPQILLFNSIQNPNLIHPGDTLRIPVSTREAGSPEESGANAAGTSRKPASSRGKKSSGPSKRQANTKPSTAAQPAAPAASDLSLSDLKSTDTKNRHRTTKTSTHSKKDQHLSAESPSAQPSSGTNAVAGQKLFDAAGKAYRNNDCRSALDLFDRYLAENPGSPRAADANLYKAECYMKMSAQ